MGEGSEWEPRVCDVPWSPAAAAAPHRDPACFPSFSVQNGAEGGGKGHTHVKSTAEWQHRTSCNKSCAVVFLLDGHQPDLSINKHVHPETFLRTP